MLTKPINELRMQLGPLQPPTSADPWRVGANWLRQARPKCPVVSFLPQQQWILLREGAWSSVLPWLQLHRCLCKIRRSRIQRTAPNKQPYLMTSWLNGKRIRIRTHTQTARFKVVITQCARNRPLNQRRVRENDSVWPDNLSQVE